MVITAIEEAQGKKITKGQKQGSEVASDISTKPANPLEELRRQAEMAYSSYLGAQRKVAKAYREREQSEVVTYKQVEDQAYKACDEAIQKALVVRAESEQNARQDYEKALGKASKEYEQNVAEALRLCRQTIEQQWRVTNELSEQIWNIFQGEGVK